MTIKDLFDEGVISVRAYHAMRVFFRNSDTAITPNNITACIDAIKARKIPGAGLKTLAEVENLRG